MVALILVGVLVGMMIPILVTLTLSVRTPIPRKAPQTKPVPPQTLAFSISYDAPSRFSDVRQRDLELLLPTVTRYGERIDSQQRDIERMLLIVAELKKQRHISKAAVPSLLVRDNIALIGPSYRTSGGLTAIDPDIDETDNASNEYATA